MNRATLTVIALSAATLSAQPPRPGRTVDWGKVEDRIAWFATWESARAAAAKTNRPILIMSAAPHCGGRPGVW